MTIDSTADGGVHGSADLLSRHDTSPPKDNSIAW
jgi:hypothetical protein